MAPFIINVFDFPPMLKSLESTFSSTLLAQHRVLASELNEKSANPSQVQELLYAKFTSQSDQYDLLVSTVIESQSTLLVDFCSFKRLALERNIVSPRFSDISLSHPEIKEINILAIYDLHTSFQEVLKPFILTPRLKSKKYSNKSQIISLKSNLNNAEPQIESSIVSKSKKESDFRSSTLMNVETKDKKKNQPLEKKCSFSKPASSVLTTYPTMRAKLSQAKAQSEAVKQQQQKNLKTSTPASSKKMTMESDDQLYEKHSFARMMEIEDNKVSVPSSKIEAESDSDDDIFAKMEQVNQKITVKQSVVKPPTPIVAKESKPTQKTSQTSLTSWFGRA